MTKSFFNKFLSIGASGALFSSQAFGAYAPAATNGMDPTGSMPTNEAMPSDVNKTTTDSISTRMSELPKTLVSMDFADAEIRDVLHMLALKSNMNIIYGSDVSGPINIHLDRVPFDQAFQTVLTLKNLVALPMGPKIIRVVTSSNLTTEQSQAATFTRVFRLNYAVAADIKSPLDSIRNAAGRKGVSSVDSKTNSIIVTDTLEGLQQVEELLPTLDRKPQQVDIEAKIVEVTLDEDYDLGISWSFAKDAGNHHFGKTEAVQASDAAGSTPTRDATVTQLKGSTEGGSGIDLFPAAIVNSGFPTALTYLYGEKSFIFAARVAALAAKGKAKLLSTPHIVTLNNEEAKINVTDQIPYPVSTVSNGVSQASVQFVEAGVKLTVKPTVNANRQITLKVKPEVSESGGNAQPGLPPTIKTRNAETVVILKDGETIAIGGLIRERTADSISGIPLLMDIPILGNFFRSTSKTSERTELIVFLTPKIAGE